MAFSLRKGQERDTDAFGESVGILPVARGDETGAGRAIKSRI